ncbi:MAG: heat-inducible transcription repressor HrcA [Clostridiales bacterium]|nr:heat-inducible transcription repressor HrcA [Clostridiales bacterium]MBQ3046580.1 heat-inducible transcription repressor HrcA [Clostridia bacterium]
MKLSDRKRKILQLVVDDYISTAQPVSSKSITEKHMPNVSSATVRSELAQLEELGYLSQLHTSSGRVPSVEAYKLYVSELMDKSKLTAKEVGAIRDAFEGHADNLETVVQNAVKVISDLTDYTSVGYTAHSDKNKIIKIDLFRYKPTQALLLIVTENTLIRDRFISIPEVMTDAQLIEASELIARLFVGKEFGEIIGLGDVIKEEFQGYREIFDSVMSAIEDYIAKSGSNVILEGEGKILNHPEYNDSEKVKNFLSVVTSKNKLAGLLADNTDNIEINIKIGGEEGKDMPEDCSLVTATYSASGVKIGTYGVIGPLRMDYQKVVSVLEGVGKILEDMLKDKK